MATRWLEHDGGRLASDEGQGPLVVCVPGLGDLRQEYRFLSAALVAAGYRVASVDLRGHGESSTGWDDMTPEAVGADILALVQELDAGRALVVGTSMAAGAAVWAAAEEPTSVAGIVLIGPFVRDVGSPVVQRMLRLALPGLLARPWGVSFWMRYWASLFPSRKPPDFDSYAAELRGTLKQRGRLAALRQMLLGPSRREIEARLARVSAPTLVLMGTDDRDFHDPAAEARLVADRTRGTVELIDGAGHYPHVEFPDQAAGLVIRFAHSSTQSADIGGTREKIATGLHAE
jgi:pimeloyl-ACP methyl ester carboxylesterase